MTKDIREIGWEVVEWMRLSVVNTVMNLVLP